MEVEYEQRVLFAYYVYKFYICKKKRKYWVHPYVSARALQGAFARDFMDLRGDEVKFFNYFRMSQKSFDELHVKLSESLKAQDTNMRLAISPMEMLAVTLR